MKRKWIRLACGLDIDKKKIHACFGGQDEQGDFVIQAQKKFSKSPGGIKEFLVWLKKYNDKLNKSRQLPFQLLMEISGSTVSNGF